MPMWLLWPPSAGRKARSAMCDDYLLGAIVLPDGSQRGIIKRNPSAEPFIRPIVSDVVGNAMIMVSGGVLMPMFVDTITQFSDPVDEGLR
jgi:hypothetical protein